MDPSPSTSPGQKEQTSPSRDEPRDVVNEPRVHSCIFTTPRRVIKYNPADSFPMFKKMRHEHGLMRDLGETLNLDDIDLQSFGHSLAVMARYISKNEMKKKERSPLHHKVSFMMDVFFSKHEAFYENHDSSIFHIMHRAVASSSNKELQEVLYALSAIFVLSGPLLFRRPKTVKFLGRIFDCIPKGRSAKLDKLRLLTIRCMLWSFSRLALWGIDDTIAWWSAILMVEPHIKIDEVAEVLSFLLNSEYPPKAETDKRDFLGAKIGSILLLTLIERRRDDQSQALCVKLLHVLLSSGRDDWPDAPVSLVHDSFLKVEALINDEKSEDSQEAPNTHHALRALSEEELNAAWDFLASAWYIVVRTEVKNAPRGSLKLKEQSTHMWILLLRTCGKAEDAIGVICDAHVKLFFELRNRRKTNGMMDIPLLHAMQAIRQLWLVTMDHLDIDIRAAVAEIILRRLLERRDVYGDFEGAMMVAWYKLIEELVFCDPMRALSAIATVRAPKEGRSLLHRRIWCDIMHYVVVEEVRARGVMSYFSICEMVEFLRFPYRVGFDQMDEYAHLLWDTLLGRAFDIAQERRRTSIVLELMEEVAREYGVKVNEGVTEKIREEENAFREADKSRHPRSKRWRRGRGNSKTTLLSYCVASVSKSVSPDI